MYSCMYVCMHACMYGCMYVYIYVCVCVCVCAYKCKYAPTYRTRIQHTRTRTGDLLDACMLGHAVLARFFLNQGGDIEAQRNISRETPLILAAACGHVRCVELLLDQGADMHARDAKKRKPKALALARGDHKGRLVADLLTKKERQGGDGGSIFRGLFARFTGRQSDAHVDLSSDVCKQKHSRLDNTQNIRANAAGRSSGPASVDKAGRKEEQTGDKSTQARVPWRDNLVLSKNLWVRVWCVSAVGFLGALVAMFFSGDLDLFLVVH
jgi:hypothetical protein